MRAAAIITYDARGVVLGWNAGAALLSGHAEEGLLGRPLSTVLDPVDDAGACEDGERRGVLITRRGERLTVQRTRSTVRDPRGAVVAYVEVLCEPDAHVSGSAQTPPARRELPLLGWLHGGGGEAERRLQVLADTMPQLVWCSDAEGAGAYLSERWREYVGVPFEQMLGARWLEHIHPDDRAQVAERWQACVEQECEFHSEYRVRRHDGAYRWIQTRASALRDEDGRVVEWFGCNTDVHDARALQDTLQRERELLTSWIVTAPGIAYIYHVEPDGKSYFPRVGPGIEEIYGLTAEELARDASPVWARMLPEDVPALVEGQAQAMRTLSPFRCEFRLRHPSRGIVWVESSSSPAGQQDGAYEWVGFLRDITERKQAEVAMRAVQAQLVAALEAGGMGLWQWEVTRDALHMDDLLLSLLGRGREELSGTSRDAHAFVAPEDVEAVRTVMHALTLDDTRRDFEHRVVRPDGQVRWLSVRAKSERDESGAVARVTALNIDVTQQKHATDAQLHSQKLEALGTLAGGIAHDFNNILQAISGNTTLALLAEPSSQRVRGFLNEVATAATRASDLVRQILAFSRPDEQPTRAISLADAVGEALKLVRATLPTTIAIHIELDKHAPPVAADASKIHQVVVNLATNAAHALSATGGEIDVRLQAVTFSEDASSLAPELQAGSYVALHVRDNGCGIPPAALPRIFDPFYTTKPVGQGTGLGLSVVHGIVKGLEGAVTVRSELGIGSTFSVYLPALSDATLETEQSIRETVPPRARGQRVLFVDDERMLVTLGVGILKMLGLRPTGFSDPLAALAAFEAEPQQFDAVITDAAMPVLSGYQLAERLLALRPDLPIIMLSGYVGPEELVHAEQLGVRELLLKPVSIDKLNGALARALHRQTRGLRALSRR